jgi:hypothetical protein
MSGGGIPRKGGAVANEEAPETDAGPDRRWQSVIIAILIALILLLLGYCTVRSTDTDPIADPTPSVSATTSGTGTTTAATTATNSEQLPVVTRTTESGATAATTARPTPSAAPQTDGGSTGPGGGVLRVAGGLVLLVGAVLSGAFAASRWRQARA